MLHVPFLNLKGNAQPLLTLWVSAEMLVTPFTLKSNGASVYPALAMKTMR